MITLEDLHKKLKEEVPDAIENWREEPGVPETEILNNMIIWAFCIWDADAYKDLMPNEIAEDLRNGIPPKTLQDCMEYINSDGDLQEDVPNDIVSFYKAK